MSAFSKFLYSKNKYLRIFHYLEVYYKMFMYSTKRIHKHYDTRILSYRDTYVPIFRDRFDTYLKVSQLVYSNYIYVSGVHKGFCNYISQATENNFLYAYSLWSYPELVYFVPKHKYGSYWFEPENQHIRKIIIKFIIKNQNICYDENRKPSV